MHEAYIIVICGVRRSHMLTRDGRLSRRSGESSVSLLSSTYLRVEVVRPIMLIVSATNSFCRVVRFLKASLFSSVS